MHYIIKYFLYSFIIYLTLSGSVVQAKISQPKSAIEKPLTIQVCPQCEHKSIKSAVEVAPTGSTILISSGVYNESDIQIKKTMHLVGDASGKTIIDGQNLNQHILIISATENTSIENIEFRNTGMSFTKELAGIRAIQSKDCLIKNNRFVNTTYAIYLDNSEHCTVSGNTMEGTATDEVSGGNAVHIWFGGSHIIDHNNINGHRDGIYLEFSTKTKIYENRVHNSLRYGLHFMQSSLSESYNNLFEHSGSGVAIMYSNNIKMINNFFSQNAGPASYGLLLKEVHDSEIFNNNIDNNTVGIFMESSNRIQLKNNLFLRNGWGLRIMGDCESNNFIHNNFIDNTFEVTTNADHSWNSFDENYWSQYDGYDLDKDGFGDNPYRPVSLSSVIIERVDSAYILMGSFFFTILDQVERTLPSLIPEPLKDQKPSMKAYTAGAHL